MGGHNSFHNRSFERVWSSVRGERCFRTDGLTIEYRTRWRGGREGQLAVKDMGSMGKIYRLFKGRVEKTEV